LGATKELDSLPSPDEAFTAHHLPPTKDPRQKALYASPITHYDGIICDDLAIYPYDQPGPLLTNCTLRGALPAAASALRLWRFAHCDLRHSDFSKLTLTYTVFVSCDLSDVDLSSALLNNCLFYDCDLTRTNFTAASFMGTRICHSDPHAAVFGYVRADDVLSNDLGPAYTAGLAPQRIPTSAGFLHSVRPDPAWLTSQVPALPLAAASTLLLEHPELSVAGALTMARAIYV
jgi:hypothetical protein